VKKLPMLVLPAALLLLPGCLRNHAPVVTALSAGPEIFLRDTTYTFAAIAIDPDGDSVAVRFDWGDSTVSDWSGWSASGRTVALVHAWHSQGTYKVVAQARDQKLDSSGWSGAPSTTLIVRRTPALPAAPTGPDRGGQDSAYIFTAAALQPDNAMVAIRFAWGDGDTSAWSDFVASGESASMSHAWAAPDTYAVTAQAKDTGDAPSRWSAPRDIVIRPPDTLRIWRFQLAAGPVFTLYSSPAIGLDGTIYVGSRDNSLYAVYPDGVLKWCYLTEGTVRSSPAIGTDGTVYFGSDDNRLYALAPDNGTVKWSYLTSGNVQTAPAIALDGTVYAGSHDKRLYALSPDGTLKWSFKSGGNITSSPAIAADGTVYFGSDDQCFYALNPDGTQKWSLNVTGHVNYSSAAVGSDGTIYCGSDLNRTTENFYALYSVGTRRWSCMLGRNVRSSPAIAPDGTIYIGTDRGYLYAVNPDGSAKWSYQTDGDILYSSPAVGSDGTVYVGAQDNFLYALNPDGTLKWRYETDGDIRSAPAIGPDGTVYFTSCDGYLYALKGTSPLADSPWPKFHHDARNTGRAGGR
jgi:outer membrane protein assembly factor BamB